MSSPAMSTPPAGGGGDPSASGGAGQVIGDFRLVRELGRGGMAVVWEAEQLSVGRRCALKLLHPHLALSAQSIERFQREARAGGRLSEPGIVQVYAVGEAGGIHYLAQELVRGGCSLADSLADLRRERELPEGYHACTAELFARICDSLEHAHREGVIHRDVKPSNILIAEGDRPKVADFGLAQIEDELALSRTGDFVGTPFYMSPEQAASRRMGIDHRTDVFSLGATLYEALTLVRPFGGDTSQQVFRSILTEDPRDPCAVRSKVPRELAVICMKALEKNPERRFASMAEMAEELGRFLRHEPIRSRPPGLLSRAAKWSLRHPVRSTAAAIVVGALAVISALALHLRQERDSRRAAWVEAEAARARAAELAESERGARIEEAAAREAAESALREQRWTAYVGDVTAASLALDHDEVEEARARLERCPPEARGWEWRRLDVEASLREVSPCTLLEGHSKPVNGLAFAAGGTLLASWSDDGTARVWPLRSGREPLVLRGDGKAVSAAAIRADGRRLVAAARNGRLWLWSVEPDGSGSNLVAELEGHARRVNAVVFSPDGERIASGGIDGAIRTWDASDGRALGELTGQAGRVTCLAFDSAGEFLASGSSDGSVLVWDVREPRAMHAFAGDAANVHAVSILRGESRVVALSTDMTIRSWDLESGEQVFTRRCDGVLMSSSAIAASGDGLVAAATALPTAQVYSSRTGQTLATLSGRGRAISCVAITPDARFAATETSARAVSLWELPAGRPAGVFRTDAALASLLAIDPDGSRVACPSTDGRILLWDAAAAADSGAARSHDGSVSRVAISPDGARFASASWDHSVRIWDGGSGEELRALRGHEDVVECLVWSPDGRRLVSGGWDHAARVWDAESGECLRVLGAGLAGAVRAVALDPDGRRVATSWRASPSAGSGSFVEALRVWDARNGDLLQSMDVDLKIQCLAITRDGTRVLCGCADGAVRILDLATLEQRSSLLGHAQIVWDVCESADGSRIGSASWDGTARVWDAATGAALAVLSGNAGPVRCVVFDRDATRAFTGSADGAIRVWDVRTAALVGTLHGHSSSVNSLSLAPDGSRLVSGSADGTVRIWDTQLEPARRVRLGR